jgi:L-fuculose-phosphate aldolase
VRAENALRAKIVETGKAMAKLGLTAFLGVYAPGNVSARLPMSDRIIVTPSGYAKGMLRPDDLVVVNLRGERAQGRLQPSTETPMHLAIYRRRRHVNAIVHSHSAMSLAFSVAKKEIPATTIELAAVAGGAVPVAPYATPGSEEVAEMTAKVLGKRNAVLMQNHGLVTVGRDLAEALNIAVAVEYTAQVTLYSKLLGKTIPISPIEVSKVGRGIVESYGQKRPRRHQSV